MNNHSSHVPVHSFAPICKLMAIAFLATGMLASAQAQIISVNLTPGGTAFGTTPTTLASSDLAGAPGVRTNDWNNITSASFSGASLVDSSGSTVSGLTLTVSGPNPNTRNNVGSASQNDYTVFNTVIDISSSASISLSGIPYNAYDLFFYIFPETTSTTARGGHITIGSTTYYVNGGNGANAVSMPGTDGSGYVLSTATTLLASQSTPGNYVKFTGLTGSSQTVSLVSDNFGDNTPRLKVGGFQLVAVPEPSTLAMLGMGVLGLAGMFRARLRK